MPDLPDDGFSEPFTVTVNGPVVVLMGVDGVGVSMKPEAVLASIAPMRRCAEEALRNRQAGKHAQSEI
jgi:hypothetical protein